MCAIKIGASVSMDSNYEEAFYLFHHYGFDYIELYIPIHINLNIELINTLYELGSMLPVKVIHISDIIPDKNDLKIKLEQIRAISRLNTVNTIVVHWNSNHTDTIHFFEKIEILNSLKNVADNYGMMVSIENVSENTWAFDEVFRYIPDIYMTLDVGHANLYCNHDRAVEFISAYSTRIANMHFHDNIGGDKSEWDLHLPIGVGNINFSQIIKMLKNIKYSHTITIELNCTDKTYFDISRRKLQFMLKNEII